MKNKRLNNKRSVKSVIIAAGVAVVSALFWGAAVSGCNCCVCCNEKSPSDDVLIAEMKALIQNDGYASIAAQNGAVVGKESGRGLKPLLTLLDQGCLDNALVVDKVIGRAAAAALVVGKSRKIHALLMGEDAKAFLEAHGIESSADKIVPKILGRDLVSDCPLEASVKGIDDPEQMLEAVKAKIKALSAAK